METTERITEEDLASFHKCQLDPFCRHLRLALDGYLDNSNQGMQSPSFVIAPHLSEGSSGLGSFDKDYYRSRFVVISIEGALCGGKLLTVLFREKPDKLFCGWIYKLGDGAGYDLRGWWEKPTDKEGLKMFVDRLRGIIMDDEEGAL